MGSQGSKLDPTDESLPPKIRPLLRRKFQEIKQRRHDISLKNQTPSKKVLLNDGVEEDDHSSSHSPPHHATKTINSGDGCGDSEEMVVEDKNAEKEDRSDEEDDTFRRTGSPSFRVYCNDAVESDNEDEEDEDIKKPMQSDDADETVKSEDHHEESCNKEQKKPRKAKGFRRVMTKGKPVKRLFSVSSCYSPGCGGHDHARLLEGKTIA